MAQQKVFHSLNALRGCAAVAVLLFHAEAFFQVQILPSGYLAVDLFFILSGFVISHTYDPRFENGLSARSFIVARAIRFWPLFALSTILGAGWLFLENIVAPPAVMTIPEISFAAAQALIYIPKLTTGDLFPLNVPAWSLFFELLVNGLFGLSFLASKTRWLTGAIFLSGIAVAAAALSGFFGMQALGFFRAAFGFALGVFLCRSRWSAPKLPAWAVQTIIVATFALPSNPAVQMACVFLIYPLGILILVRCSSDRTASLFDTIGALSFPLYALHYPILQVWLGVRDHVPVPAYIIGIIAILTCLIAAWLGEQWVDKPARIYLQARNRSPES